MEIPTLYFEDFCLRAFKESDVSALTALHADPEVMRYLTADGKPETKPRSAWNYIALHMGHWHLKGYGKWALARRGSDELIGRVGYFDPPYEWPGLELGWTIAKAEWGKGLATKAARAALDWGFKTLPTDEIISAIDPGNTRSIKVAERLGANFARETLLYEKRYLIYASRREKWQANYSTPT